MYTKRLIFRSTFLSKLQPLFIWTKMLDNQLIAKCFIYDVVCWCFYSFPFLTSSSVSINICTLVEGFLYNSSCFERLHASLHFSFSLIFRVLSMIPFL